MWVALLVVVIWLLAGFVGFILEAKMNKWTEAKKFIKDEFCACLKLGVFSPVLVIWDFDRFLNWLLERINKGEKNKNE